MKKTKAKIDNRTYSVSVRNKLKTHIFPIELHLAHGSLQSIFFGCRTTDLIQPTNQPIQETIMLFTSTTHIPQKHTKNKPRKQKGQFQRKGQMKTQLEHKTWGVIRTQQINRRNTPKKILKKIPNEKAGCIPLAMLSP